MFLLALFVCISLSYTQGQFHYDGHHYAHPYQVGYYLRDPHRQQHAEEIRDYAGAVDGRYGYLDARGIGRQVNYVADHAGLRARVYTNEPAIVHNTPLVAARVVSDDVTASRVAAVPVYESLTDYRYGVNEYGHGYEGYGRGYGYSGLDERYYGLGHGYSDFNRRNYPHGHEYSGLP